MKERNIASSVCKKCKKFVAPRSGWMVKGGFGARFVYHSRCYDEKIDEEKKKLAERMAAAAKYPKNKG